MSDIISLRILMLLEFCCLYYFYLVFGDNVLVVVYIMDYFEFYEIFYYLKIYGEFFFINFSRMLVILLIGIDFKVKF